MPNMPGKSMKRKNTEPLPSSNKVSRSASMTAISLPINQSQGQGTSKPNHKSKNISASQPVAAPQPSDPNTVADDLHNHACVVCRADIDDDVRNATTLQCCLCDSFFHGECCNVDEANMDFLHVMNAIGGWCCLNCRSLNRGKTTKPQNLTQKNAGNINDIQIKLSKMNDQIAELTVGLNKIFSSIPNAGNLSAGLSSLTPPHPFSMPVETSKGTYANVLKSSNTVLTSRASGTETNNASSSGLEKKIQTAVLSAVHEEFHSISQRSHNIVVTGLKTSDVTPDDTLFRELCFSMLDIDPHIKSTSRFKKTTDGKVQPLLITFDSVEEVSNILARAKNLRKSPSDYVRQNVYINKHMTKAEALTAYNARLKRRQNKRSQETNLDQSGKASTFNSAANAPVDHSNVGVSNAAPVTVCSQPDSIDCVSPNVRNDIKPSFTPAAADRINTSNVAASPNVMSSSPTDISTTA